MGDTFFLCCQAPLSFSLNPLMMPMKLIRTMAITKVSPSTISSETPSRLERCLSSQRIWALSRHVLLRSGNYGSQANPEHQSMETRVNVTAVVTEKCHRSHFDQ